MRTKEKGKERRKETKDLILRLKKEEKEMG